MGDHTKYYTFIRRTHFKLISCVENIRNYKISPHWKKSKIYHLKIVFIFLVPETSIFCSLDFIFQ